MTWFGTTSNPVLTRTKLSPSNLTCFALNAGSSLILSVLMVRQMLVLVAKFMYMSVAMGMSRIVVKIFGMLPRSHAVASASLWGFSGSPKRSPLLGRGASRHHGRCTACIGTEIHICCNSNYTRFLSAWMHVSAKPRNRVRFVWCLGWVFVVLKHPSLWMLCRYFKGLFAIVKGFNSESPCWVTTTKQKPIHFEG